MSRRQTLAHAQEIITPFYDPADPSTATCQNDAFSLAREEWFVGVPNTTIFPHSAICQLRMTAPDGSGYMGTGFYIGSRRILTCAHNLAGMNSVTIIPGRNGAGNDPFGQCTVSSSSWRIAPAYGGDGDWSNDLAVIDGVPLAAPNSRWFGFLNATPSDRLPIVVCGYSAASNAVPELTQAIDRDKQHLHGGYAPEQTNRRSSNIPSSHSETVARRCIMSIPAAANQALVCAVHVTGNRRRKVSTRLFHRSGEDRLDRRPRQGLRDEQPGAEDFFRRWAASRLRRDGRKRRRRQIRRDAQAETASIARTRPRQCRHGDHDRRLPTWFHPRQFG
jgi:hypothetical protein